MYNRYTTAFEQDLISDFMNFCKHFFKYLHEYFLVKKENLDSTYCLTIVSVNKFISKLKLNFVNLLKLKVVFALLSSTNIF